MFDGDFSLPTDNVNSRSNIWDVATDVKGNIFLLTAFEKPRTEKSRWVYRLAQTADLNYRFRQREVVDYIGLSGSETGNKSLHHWRNMTMTESFFCSFGEGILKNLWDIRGAKDGCVMVVDTEDSCVYTSANTATV